MKKTALTITLAFTALLAFSQDVKQSKQPITPRQEVKPSDSLINVSISPQNLKDIYGILTNVITTLENSDAPSKKTKEIKTQLEGLAQFLSTRQPKKEK
jgi:hypothetical protein